MCRVHYFNIVFAYGIEKFCNDTKEAGIKGLIVPDFPLEEESSEHLNEFLEKYGLLNIKVLSPASTELRIKMNAEVGTGFVYCTARQGITGTQKGFDPKVINYLKTVRKYFKIHIISYFPYVIFLYETIKYFRFKFILVNLIH